MKTDYRAFWPLAALALSAATLAGPALAAPTVYFNPVSQSVALGPTVSVDIMVKDIDVGQSIGAVGMTLNWNSFVLSGNSFVVDPVPVMGVALDSLNDNTGPFMIGSLLFFFVADISIDEATLEANQGSGFKLASVTFNTVGNGSSPLTFSNANLFGFDGITNLGARFDTGSVCVGDPAGCVGRIPEPTTPLLVMAALGGLAFTRRAQRKAA